MMKDKKKMIWCELVQALDKTNVLQRRRTERLGGTTSKVQKL